MSLYFSVKIIFFVMRWCAGLTSGRSYLLGRLVEAEVNVDYGDFFLDDEISVEG